MRDEEYIIALCDDVLGLKAERQKRFDFLRGDGPRAIRLPVDAYYARHRLVIEFQEKQHTEPVKLFDRRMTVSGVTRDEQRRRYDERRQVLLPQHGISLIVISYSDFECDGNKKLRRNPVADRKVLIRKLENWLPVASRARH
jgi:very-short-patch-repair endonuclease